jgi:hypothetical protein
MITGVSARNWQCRLSHALALVHILIRALLHHSWSVYTRCLLALVDNVQYNDTRRHDGKHVHRGDIPSVGFILVEPD